LAEENKILRAAIGWRGRTLSAFGLILPLSLVAIAAIAAEPAAVPDERLTPGLIATTNATEACAGGPGEYSRHHRVWHNNVSTGYGLPLSAMGTVEDDDRMPVCLGGDNDSPLNHWPQPLSSAREKDQLEAAVCRMVFDEHSVPLADAQRLFLGDWREAFRRVFGHDP
jgi:hypothetical protein